MASGTRALTAQNRFTEQALERLRAELPEFIATRRWFRAKARTIQKVEIEDIFAVAEDSYLLITRVDYANGASDYYVIEFPLSAFEDKRFRDSLLNGIASNRNFQSQTGELKSSRTTAFAADCGTAPQELESFVSSAEQSNTSIIYRDRFILKLFRKIEPGVNPDLEIGTFLTEHRFSHSPAVLGKIEYLRSDGTRYAVAILQQFVRNQGDAWKYTLDSLSTFFARAFAHNAYAPKLASYHPMDLSPAQMGAETCELLGDYANSAQLLGRRTAEMHTALADPNGGPAFAPEPFTSADGDTFCREMIGQADITFELLRRKQPALTGTAAEDAHMLLRMEHRVMEQFGRLRDESIHAARIRIHGDYHLGQVLYTGIDFMIIDFEGEPARPLSERIGKTLAMRDVAGIIRSFQYAGYAALFDRIPGLPTDPELRTAIESWSAFWSAWIGAIFLDGYFSTAGDQAFAPANASEKRTLLDSFLLHKALYEVAYELNNRPDWVRIPLRGILSLVN